MPRSASSSGAPVLSARPDSQRVASNRFGWPLGKATPQPPRAAAMMLPKNSEADAIRSKSMDIMDTLMATMDEGLKALVPSPGGASPRSRSPSEAPLAQRCPDPVVKGSGARDAFSSTKEGNSPRDMSVPHLAVSRRVGNEMGVHLRLNEATVFGQRSPRTSQNTTAAPQHQRNLPSPRPLRIGAEADGPPCAHPGWTPSFPSSLPSSIRQNCSADEQDEGKPRRPPGSDCVLTVHYREGEQPMADLLRLEGGQGAVVTVEAVSSGSKAARAGVRPGYALVTMNGRGEFTQLPGWQVRLLLEAPITLGFDPAPQRNQIGCTEIRLKRTTDALGIPSKVAVCGPKETGLLAEQVVFNPGQATLFLKTGLHSATSFDSVKDTAESGPWPPLDEPFVLNPDPRAPANSSMHKGDSAVYELRHREAQVLVGRAVHGARAEVGSSLEVEYGAPVGPRQLSPWRSPTSYCSLDCVAECVSADDPSLTGNRQHPINAPVSFTVRRNSFAGDAGLPPRLDSRLERSPTMAAQGAPAAQVHPRTPARVTASSFASQSFSFQDPGTSGVKEMENMWSQTSTYDDFLERKAQKMSRTRCGHCDELDEDPDDENWLDFRSSRSPLRWLAPVLEPVVRAFSPDHAASPSRTSPRGHSPGHSPRHSPGHSPRGSAQRGPSTGAVGSNRVASPARPVSFNQHGPDTGSFGPNRIASPGRKFSPQLGPGAAAPLGGFRSGQQNSFIHQGRRGDHSPRGARSGTAAKPDDAWHLPPGASFSRESTLTVANSNTSPRTGPLAVSRTRSRSPHSPQPRNLTGDLTDLVMDGLDVEEFSSAPSVGMSGKAVQLVKESSPFSVSWNDGPEEFEECAAKKKVLPSSNRTLPKTLIAGSPRLASPRQSFGGLIFHT